MSINHITDYLLITELKKHKTFFSNHAELAYKEYETSRYIKQTLIKNGFCVTDNLAQTGVEGVLYGNNTKNCIMIRAEMDALLLEDGRCKHICGHDSHMAICLTLAELLALNKQHLNKSIKFIFQPAEETSAGAKKMISAGVLESPKVDEIYALHMWSDIKTGTVAICDTPHMAGGGQFQIIVEGKTSHGALPHSGLDSIVIASEIVNELQIIVSRITDPLDSVVVTVGTINGGICDNKLAGKVHITGTIRYFNIRNRDIAISRIGNICKSKELCWGCKTNFTYSERVAPMDNSKVLAKEVQSITKEAMPDVHLLTDFKTMCVDDFSEYLKEIPGVYILIGCRDNIYYPQHHPLYYVGDDAMKIGLELLYQICKVKAMEDNEYE